MIQGCRYLRRSTDRWLLSKNSMTRLGGLESWNGAGLLWICSIPITNTKGLYLYPGSNTTPSRPRLQHLSPKINTMASCSSRIHHQFIPFFISNPRHHEFPNVFCFHPWNSSSAEWRCTPDRRRLLPNALRNGALLPNSAHMSVSSMYQFLVLTCLPMRSLIYSRHMALWLWHDMSCLCVFMMVLGLEWLPWHEVYVPLSFWHVMLMFRTLLMRGWIFAKLLNSILASPNGCETCWSFSWCHYDTIEYLTCPFGHV
jgi:hypothetical protein